MSLKPSKRCTHLVQLLDEKWLRNTLLRLLNFLKAKSKQQPTGSALMLNQGEVFVYDALRSQLEPVQHQLETISDLVKPISSKPKYF